MGSIVPQVIRPLIIAAALLAACYSALLARASFLFHQDTATSVPAAVHLVPYNSAYVARLATWQPDRKVALLHRAVDLNPFAAESWIQLGLIAEMQQHDIAAAEGYYLKAVEVDRMFLPKSTLANFYFRRQDEQNYFRWATETLAITPFSASPVFEQMWLFTQDSAKIGAAIPDRPRALFEYAMFLSGAHQFSAIAPIVRRLITASRNSDAAEAGRDNLVGPLEDRLLAAGYLQPALQIWSSMKDAGWVRLPSPSPEQPLTNGNFETVFFGHGFDWMPIRTGGVRTEQVPGQKMTRFILSGDQPERCSLVQQYVPLNSNQFYRLEWKSLAHGINAPSGLSWRLHPVESKSARDLSSNDLLKTEAGAWNFKPPAGAEVFVLVLEYARPVGSTRAAGSIDVGPVSLHEQNETR